MMYSCHPDHYQIYKVRISTNLGQTFFTLWAMILPQMNTKTSWSNRSLTVGNFLGNSNIIDNHQINQRTFIKLTRTKMYLDPILSID